MRRIIQSFSTYKKAFDHSVSNPVEYWANEARELAWQKFPTQILDDSNPPFYRWFKDGKVNITQNLLDRNLEKGLGKQVAYYIESPVTDKVYIPFIVRALKLQYNSFIKEFAISQMPYINNSMYEKEILLSSICQ